VTVVTAPVVLEARGLAVAPPGAAQPAVRGISFDLHAGEWLAVTGANGSGKTTLAMALAGLWPLSEGTVRLRGASLDPADATPRREVAVVFQDPSSQLLQPTVRDELAFAARNLGRSPERIERLVAGTSRELGLTADLERDPRTLSAGRQQLVLLGAALVAEPALLVADEPGAHLDPGSRDLVLAAVRSRVGAGLSVVWVTQDEEERAAADREHVIGGLVAPEADPVSPPAPGRDPILLDVRIGAPPESGPVVRIPGLTFFQVPARGSVAVLGPNGSGKTVLLSTLAGLIRSPQITVEWQGPAGPRPIIATQYPEMQIFEERVEDELLHAALRRGMPRDAARMTISQWLGRFLGDPAGFLERRCWALSAGEKRLVGILGALLAPASLVLLDEPTAGLDANLRAEIGRLVRERAAGRPVLVATQDRDWARGLGAVLQGSNAPARNTASRRQKTD